MFIREHSQSDQKQNRKAIMRHVFTYLNIQKHPKSQKGAFGRLNPTMHTYWANWIIIRSILIANGKKCNSEAHSVAATLFSPMELVVMVSVAEFTSHKIIYIKFYFVDVVLNIRR